MGGCADSMHFGSPTSRARVPSGSASKAKALPGYEGVLFARLPAAAAPAERLCLPNPLDASTWTVQCGSHGTQPMIALAGALAQSLGADGSLEHVFVQFRMDDLGRHEYVCLGEVQPRAGKGALAGPLTVVREDEVKALKRRLDGSVTILTAAPHESTSGVIGQAFAQTPQDLELCPPRTWSRNYNVVEDLTLGPLQRVMLSADTTLRDGVERNGIKIFNHLTLIVNCFEHEAESRGRYSVGSAKYKVLYRPIHDLMKRPRETRIQVMHEIQGEIWRCLQTGSVAVHCLAGVHRAPTVVVCHYLYRHYVLGHKQVETDVGEIYRRLKAIRGKAVEPLSYLGPIIETYRDHLRQKYAERFSAVEQCPTGTASMAK